MWAGNSGTQPATGNGTCGSGTLSNTLSGASYSNAFVSTHLGQLWQGPLNGGSTQEQYLYCSSSQPHQLTGLYASGATCSNKTGPVYTSSDDSWGNVTSRTYSGTTATLSYDALDHFTQWNAGSNNFEQYAYGASGERVLRRSTNGSGTTMTVYAFGLEEHSYSGSGTLSGSTYYYRLAGRLLGKSDGTNTTFYLTDALGSVLVGFSNVANSAAIKGNQVYGPYGKQYDHQGTLGTSKGFTGQYNDSLTGLDYYGSRYYDPVVGVFLSADTVEGNASGMNPYAYVGSNPETYSDPTGQAIISSCFATCGGKEYYPPVANSGGFVGTALRYLQGVGGGGSSTSHSPSSGNGQTSKNSGVCLEVGCSSGIFADTGSSWVPGPTSSGCLSTGLGVCIAVFQPTFYRVNNAPVSLTYCPPPFGCGEGGSGDSSEVEGTKITDSLLFADTGGVPDQPLVEPGLPGGAAEEPAPGLAGEKATNIPSDYWENFSSNNAPTQTTPGVRHLSGIHINDLGMVEPYEAYYDEYGRIVGRTDITFGNEPQGIEPTHTHIYSYNEFSQGFSNGAMPFGDHIPGEFNWLFWNSGWEYLL